VVTLEWVTSGFSGYTGNIRILLDIQVQELLALQWLQLEVLVVIPGYSGNLRIFRLYLVTSGYSQHVVLLVTVVMLDSHGYSGPSGYSGVIQEFQVYLRLTHGISGYSRLRRY
jgi:hypothetical protein